MSRHTLVKNMNLDNEMNDFDGGADYDYEEDEITTEGRFSYMLRPASDPY